MDGRSKSVHVTSLQKRKLINLVSKHPELIACKVTQNFNYKDSHRLWQSIAVDCNALPGAKKTWRQWRKTFQDLRAKSKRQQKEMNGEIPISAIMFTPDEQEVLGYKNISKSDTEQSDGAKYATPIMQVDIDYQSALEMESNHQEVEPKSPQEEKVFNTEPRIRNKYRKSLTKRNSKGCTYNCDLLASQEQQKIRIKEDYMNFKKVYLKQKLKLIKEQTEALKTIARELSK